MTCKLQSVITLALLFTIASSSIAGEDHEKKLNDIIETAVNGCNNVAITTAAKMHEDFMSHEEFRNLPEESIMKLDMTNYKSMYKLCLQGISLKLASAAQGIDDSK